MIAGDVDAPAHQPKHADEGHRGDDRVERADSEIDEALNKLLSGGFDAPDDEQGEGDEPGDEPKS